MADPQDRTKHHGHGNSPAAWTAVAIIMVGSVIAGIAVVLGEWTIFYVAAIGLPLLGLLVGKVMTRMGLGSAPARRHSRSEVDALAAADAEESVQAS